MGNIRIIVISDTHGLSSRIDEVVKKQPDADYYFFLGDASSMYSGKTDTELFFENHPEYESKFICVRGNCDYNPNLEYTKILDVGSHRIYATHGHKQSVSYGYERLIYEAMREECDIILHGHTHVRHISREENIYIMCPGSASCPRDGLKPSFGIIDILPNGSIEMHNADV